MALYMVSVQEQGSEDSHVQEIYAPYIEALRCTVLPYFKMRGREVHDFEYVEDKTGLCGIVTLKAEV